MPECGPSPNAVDRPRKGAGRKRILIADDDPSLLNILRTSLNDHGFDVCGEAADGIDAIRMAAELLPDLVILDLSMPPGMNGIEVASALKRLLPEVPIVLFTLYADHIGTSLASILGIKAVASKSDGIDKLIEGVRSLLKEHH
jgi:two-component system response regulator NreC